MRIGWAILWILFSAIQVSAQEFKWGEIYASHSNTSIPVFHIETSQAADRMELRIYDVSLKPVFGTEIAKPVRRKGNFQVYEYVWRNAEELQAGVYFYIVRALKKGHTPLETLKHLKLERKEAQ